MHYVAGTIGKVMPLEQMILPSNHCITQQNIEDETQWKQDQLSKTRPCENDFSFTLGLVDFT